jgi:GntR family transcriptional regulator
MQQAIHFADPDIVNHSIPVPLYFQFSRYVEQKIKAKELLPGQLMPSEQELCEKLQVSRTVVRQAMADLEHKGLITKQSGKLSTIAYPIYKGSLMQDLRGFYEDAVLKGQKPTTRVLGLTVVPAEGQVAKALKLNEGDPVIMLNRLRFLDGEPAVLVVTYLPETKCPDLVGEDLANQSLYELLARKYGLVISQGYRTVEAIALDRADAKLFGLQPGSPSLLLKSVGLLEDGTPLEYYVAKHIGDRSQFHIYLVRDVRSSLLAGR